MKAILITLLEESKDRFLLKIPEPATLKFKAFSMKGVALHSRTFQRYWTQN